MYVGIYKAMWHGFREILISMCESLIKADPSSQLGQLAYEMLAQAFKSTSLM